MKVNKLKTGLALEDIVDGKSALEIYRILLRHEEVKMTYYGKRINLCRVLIDESIPEYGLRKEFLPDHIKGIFINIRNNGEVVISYAGKLDRNLEKDYWKSKGYSTKHAKNSMQIIDSDGKIVARYGLNRILIEFDKLDEFIDNMR